MKKIFAGVVALIATFAVAAPSFAGYCKSNDLDCLSHFNSKISSEDKLKVKNINKADIENNIKVKSNSGYNETTDNKGNGLIGTGAAQAFADATTQANTNRIDVTMPKSTVAGVPGISGIDDINIDNSASAKSLLKNVNTAKVTNNIDASANSGYNIASCNGEQSKHVGCGFSTTSNPGVGSIQTGSALASSSVVTLVNDNVISVK